VSSVTSIQYQPGDRHPASGRSPDPGIGPRFLVRIGTERIGMFQECSGLTVEYDVFPWEEGGENRFVHKLRGRAKHPNLVLKRGITHENALAKWFNDCVDKAQRKEITLELLAGDGKALRKWGFAGAYPVKWTGPTLNAGQPGAAMETLEIVHQGFAEV
jgi:phage tail-like protein